MFGMKKAAFVVLHEPGGCGILTLHRKDEASIKHYHYAAQPQNHLTASKVAQLRLFSPSCASDCGGQISSALSEYPLLPEGLQGTMARVKRNGLESAESRLQSEYTGKPCLQRRSLSVKCSRVSNDRKMKVIDAAFHSHLSGNEELCLTPSESGY